MNTVLTRSTKDDTIAIQWSDSQNHQKNTQIITADTRHDIVFVVFFSLCYYFGSSHLIHIGLGSVYHIARYTYASLEPRIPPFFFIPYLLFFSCLVGDGFEAETKSNIKRSRFCVGREWKTRLYMPIIVIVVIWCM